jgi:hypothetical protein
MWHGVSLYDDLNTARETSTRYPILGGSFAILEIVAGKEIRLEKTPGLHHWTAWGEPIASLAHVVGYV